MPTWIYVTGDFESYKYNATTLKTYIDTSKAGDDKRLENAS